MPLTVRAKALLLGLMLGSAWIQDARADTRACSQQEAIAAEEGSNRIGNWSQLYKAYQKYAHCDDGAISEGYTYSVTDLLVNQWDRFPKFVELVDKSSGFGDFVISHINETMSLSEVNKVIVNATTKCPRQAALQCARVHEAAQLSKSRI